MTAQEMNSFVHSIARNTSLASGWINDHFAFTAMDNFMRKLIRRKWFKNLVSFVPLMCLAVTWLCAVIFYVDDNDYLNIYTLASYVASFSLLALPGYAWIIWTQRFCRYTKIAWFGLLAYVIINIMAFFISLIYLDPEKHHAWQVFEVTTTGIILIMAVQSFASMKQVESGYISIDDSAIGAMKAAMYPAVIWLNLNTDLFKVLSVLMILDTIAGGIRVMRMSDEKFNIRVLFWGFCIKCMMLCIPLIPALLAKMQNGDFTLAVTAFASALAVHECISFAENLYMAKTQIRIKRFDMFTYIIKMMKNWLINWGTSALKSFTAKTQCDITDEGKPEPKE